MDLTSESTIGELYTPDGAFLCYTLEDVVRNYKTHGETAIPAGTYEIVVGWSNRFDRPMPRLLSVPFFEGILIHPGNDAADTDGCILVGRKKGVDVVWESLLAFEDLYPKIRKMCGEGKVFVEIDGGFTAGDWIGDNAESHISVDS